MNKNTITTRDVIESSWKEFERKGEIVENAEDLLNIVEHLVSGGSKALDMLQFIIDQDLLTDVSVYKEVIDVLGKLG